MLINRIPSTISDEWKDSFDCCTHQGCLQAWRPHCRLPQNDEYKSRMNPAWIPHESDWRVAHLLVGRHSFGIIFSCSLKVLFCPCGHWKALWSLASKVWDFQAFHHWRPQASNFKASDSLACVMKYFLFLKLPAWIVKTNCISVTTPSHLCFIMIQNCSHEFWARISIQPVSIN